MCGGDGGCVCLAIVCVFFAAGGTHKTRAKSNERKKREGNKGVKEIVRDGGRASRECI